MNGTFAMLSAIPILIVSGEQSHRDMLASSVSYSGLRPVCCGTCESASALLSHHPFSVVICDDTLPDGTFRTVIDHAARYAARIPVIVTSRRDDWELFLKALGAGAFDYIALPPLRGEVERILSAAIRECRVLPGTALQTSQGSIRQAVA
jgi:DNA-binding NtrC family response regulator